MQLRSFAAMAVAKAGSYSSDLTLSLRTSICLGCGPKKKKKKKQNNGIFRGKHFDTTYSEKQIVRITQDEILCFQIFSVFKLAL